jgi:hypothetical protein
MSRTSVVLDIRDKPHGLLDPPSHILFLLPNPKRFPPQISQINEGETL